MLSLQNMTPPRSRFAALNRQVLRLRHGEPLCLDVDGIDELHLTHHDVMLESAATSLQVHLKVPLRDAARYMNAFTLVSAATVALAANAAIVFGKRLWHDSRIAIFEQAVDTRDGLRVELVTRMLRTIFFRCSRVKFVNSQCCYQSNCPTIPDRVPHLRLHNGTLWSWNRPLIGFEDNGQPHVPLNIGSCRRGRRRAICLPTWPYRWAWHMG